MRKTTPLLVQLDGQSLGDVTVSIDESKITPSLDKLNVTATTISTQVASGNTELGVVAARLEAKNSADEDKSVAQSAVDACTYLETIENEVQNEVVPKLVEDQVTVGAAAKRIRDVLGQTSDADTETTAVGLLKKIKANTEGVSTESTLATRASEATLALVSKDASVQDLKTLVGTADDAAGTNTVIGLLKGIATKFE